MKVCILAGGYGTRLAELTDVVPKPMVDVGGYPILWHIMSIYSQYGHRDFAVALGYKGDVIRNYFTTYFKVDPKCRVSVAGDRTTIEFADKTTWNIDLVDTGQNTMTGGRLKRLKPSINNEPFMITYGDGVADINIEALVDFHKKQNTMVTVTAVHPTSRYGKLDLTGNLVERFSEKPTFNDEWINGGFFVAKPEFLELIDDDTCVLERVPLETVAAQKQLAAFKHEGFWHCMDTLRDKKELDEMWQSGKAPWVKHK